MINKIFSDMLVEFQGLTGLLQSPIKEAEKHGLPGVLSGIAWQLCFKFQLLLTWRVSWLYLSAAQTSTMCRLWYKPVHIEKQADQTNLLVMIFLNCLVQCY